MAQFPYMKAVPILNESSSYEAFVKEIKIWRLLKVCTAEEEGPMLFRTLTGKAKEAAMKLQVEQIGSAQGLDLILKELNKLYLSDENTRMFTALERFEQYKRPNELGISQFILEFEDLHDKVKQFNVNYPDVVLGFKLMKAARLSPENEKLVRATIATGKFSSATVTEQLKKVINDENSCTESKLPIKEEGATALYQENEDAVFYGNQKQNQYSSKYNFDSRYRGNSMRGYNTRGRFNPSRNFRQPNPQGMQFLRQPNPQGMQIKKNFQNQMNPKDSKGNLTKCHKCKSIYHWIENCPHASIQEKTQNSYCIFDTQDDENEYSLSDLDFQTQHDSNNINSQAHEQELDNLYPMYDTFFIHNETKCIDDKILTILYQSTDPIQGDQLVYLVRESLNMAILDSGCPKTVCGKLWFDNFSESLNKNLKITTSESQSKFRFGDSQAVKSLFKAVLPLTIQGKVINVESEVISNEIPLLISNSTLRKAGANMNYKDDSLTFMGIEQPLILTSTGHYAIPILDQNRETKNTVFLTTNYYKFGDEKQVARKLHVQFNHAHGYRLVKLLKDAKINDERLMKAVKDIEVTCSICQLYKKTPPRPVVTFPLATRFNEVIALDLKTIVKDKTYFIHIIDHATRFSAASVIHSKSKEIIIAEFFKIWISIFGHPEKVLVDNGKEFVNKDFGDLCENFNIKLKTTSAESAWSNGLCEKYNGVIGEAVKKVIEDVGCSLEIALAWSVNAKNSLHNVCGYSPYQMVFGQNPNLPLSFNSKLPALEGISSSELVRKNLNALHVARQEFVRLESCEKFRRAMRARFRTYANQRYFQGDSVYYKRNDDDKWKGPAKVIFQDNSKIWIKSPETHIPISVHPCRLQLVKHENSQSSESQSVKEGQHLQENNKLDITKSQINEIQLEPEDVEINQENQRGIQEEPGNLQDLEGNEVQEQIENQNIEVNRSRFTNEMLLEHKQLPKANEFIRYKLIGENDWKNCKILSRGGKAQGDNRFWMNIRDSNDQEYGIDWKKSIAEWEILEHNVFLSGIENEYYEKAKQKELDNFKLMKVYSEVKDNGQLAISVRWVFSKKIKEDKEELKARLVARGCEEDKGSLERQSPTCHKESLRVALFINACMNWEMNSLDVKCAFLQGKLLEREVYLRPPREANVKGVLWKLNKCVYGLVDASRHWYFRVKEELLKRNCKVSKLDPAVFYYYDNGLKGFLLSHVDDFFFAGSEAFKKMIEELKKVFIVSREDSYAFKYLGMELQQTNKGIFLSLHKYTSDLEEISLDKDRKSNRDLVLIDKEKNELRSIIGQLNWLSLVSRPDICFDVCQLSNSFKNATIDTIHNANKIIRKVKMKNTCLFFQKMNLNNLTLISYSDASHANLPDGGSQGGLYIEVTDGFKHTPIHWQSKRIRRVVQSSMAAELLALIEAIETTVLVREFMGELLFMNKRQIPIKAYIDNKSVFDSAHATNQIEDKSLRINLGILREHIKLKDIELIWIPTHNQLANVLTKTGCSFSELLNRICPGNH